MNTETMIPDQLPSEGKSTGGGEIYSHMTETMRERKKKPLFPQKGKIIVILKNGIVMHGDGLIDATKNTFGDYQITGNLTIKNHAQ